MPTIHPHIDPQTNAILVRLAAQQGETPSAVARKLLQTAVEQSDVGRTVSNLHRRIDELIGRIERLAETHAEALDRAAKTETRLGNLEIGVAEIQNSLSKIPAAFQTINKNIFGVATRAEKSAEAAEAVLTALTDAAKPVVKK